MTNNPYTNNPSSSNRISTRKAPIQTHLKIHLSLKPNLKKKGKGTKIKEL